MNFTLVDRTPSSVTLTWDHQIISFTLAYFIVEYSCDNWATIQSVTTTSPNVTITGLDVYPATYQFRVRTVIFDVPEGVELGVMKEGPNSEILDCEIFSYLLTIVTVNK